MGWQNHELRVAQGLPMCPGFACDPVHVLRAERGTIFSCVLPIPAHLTFARVTVTRCMHRRWPGWHPHKPWALLFLLKVLTGMSYQGSGIAPEELPPVADAARTLLALGRGACGLPWHWQAPYL
jgi:hypothetical protein